MRAVESSPTFAIAVGTGADTGVATGVAAGATRDAAIDGVGRPGPDGIAGVATGVPPFIPVVMAAIHLPLSFVARALKTPSPLRYSNSAGVPSSRRRSASGGAISRSNPNSCVAPSACLVKGTVAPSFTSEASSFSTRRSASARLLTMTESSRSSCGIRLRQSSG
jgi:hypothetical protein